MPGQIIARPGAHLVWSVFDQTQEVSLKDEEGVEELQAEEKMNGHPPRRPPGEPPPRRPPDDPDDQGRI